MFNDGDHIYSYMNSRDCALIQSKIFKRDAKFPKKPIPVRSKPHGRCPNTVYAGERTWSSLRGRRRSGRRCSHKSKRRRSEKNNNNKLTEIQESMSRKPAAEPGCFVCFPPQPRRLASAIIAAASSASAVALPQRSRAADKQKKKRSVQQSSAGLPARQRGGEEGEGVDEKEGGPVWHLKAAAVVRTGPVAQTA